MATFERSLVVANADDDGYELLEDLHLEGQLVAAADLGAQSGITDGEFRRDLISVDPEDGSVTVTEGAETSDGESASAVAPDVPADEVVLAVGLMGGVAGPDVEVVDIELDRLGEDARVSADE